MNSEHILCSMLISISTHSSAHGSLFHLWKHVAPLKLPQIHLNHPHLSPPPPCRSLPMDPSEPVLTSDWPAAAKQLQTVFASEERLHFVTTQIKFLQEGLGPLPRMYLFLLSLVILNSTHFMDLTKVRTRSGIQFLVGTNIKDETPPPCYHSPESPHLVQILR
jgi:hypothetical protein